MQIVSELQRTCLAVAINCGEYAFSIWVFPQRLRGTEPEASPGPVEHISLMLLGIKTLCSRQGGVQRVRESPFLVCYWVLISVVPSSWQ